MIKVVLLLAVTLIVPSLYFKYAPIKDGLIGQLNQLQHEVDEVKKLYDL